MSTSVNFHPQPKPRPSALVRADRRKAITAKDDMGSTAVRKRSHGQCEVTWFGATGRVEYRCQRRAFHVHHRLSGRGVRGVGASALAANKLHVCDRCHSEIHAHILVPDGDQFRRVR